MLERSKRLVLMVSAVTLLAACGGSDESAGTAQQEAASTEPSAPTLQDKFVELTLQAREDFRAAATDLQEAEIYRLRDQALCEALGDDLIAEGWVGEISSIGANGDGDAYVEIEVADDVEIGTFNNVLSDLMYSTLIDRGTDMHTTLLSLERGDEVYFSGEFMSGSETCLYNKRLTEDGSLRDPSFLMRFWAIQPTSEGPYQPVPRPADGREETASDSSGSDSGEEGAAAGSPPPWPTPTQATLSGSGADFIVLDDPLEGAFAVRVEGNADGRYFGVRTVDAAGERLDGLVNTTDPYDGTRPIGLDGEVAYGFEIDAQGSWTIEILSLADMPLVTNGESFNGSGDTVLQVSTSGLTTAQIVGNSESRYFGVRAWTDDGRDGLVNTTDPYDGRVRIPNGAVLIEVEAIGEWSVILE